MIINRLTSDSEFKYPSISLESRRKRLLIRARDRYRLDIALRASCVSAREFYPMAIFSSDWNSLTFRFAGGRVRICIHERAQTISFTPPRAPSSRTLISALHVLAPQLTHVPLPRVHARTHARIRDRNYYLTQAFDHELKMMICGGT